jgi:FlaA1/EpsC-like NDP-sugar epimerase
MKSRISLRDRNNIKAYFKGKTILVTGGAGSIGSEIVREVLECEPLVVRVFDNNETALFELQQELNKENLRMFVGDIRDIERCRRAVEDVDIVFHAAALKHVPLCEYNPFEAVKTNVLGTQNIIEVSMDEEVEKMITISTDKAVNPTNVLGATKLLGERLTTSANFYKGDRKTVLSCVRFGNVLCSRGSVAPIFKRQIESGGPVTITSPNMTRFVMSISEAVSLILKAAKMAEGGEIFILKMPAVRIKDLARVMIQELAAKNGYDSKKIELEIIGSRAGEKLYEELFTNDEAKMAYEKDDVFIMNSQDETQQNNTLSKTGLKQYTSNSAPILSEAEIKQLLVDVGLL